MRVFNVTLLDASDPAKTLTTEKAKDPFAAEKKRTLHDTPCLENKMAPNDIKMEFKTHQCNVWELKRLSQSSTTKPRGLFLHTRELLKAAKLWNLLSKEVNERTVLEHFKVVLGEYIDKFPDTPPTKGYATVNRNSLLEWTLEEDFCRRTHMMPLS